MAIKETLLDYVEEATTFEGFFAAPDDAAGEVPGVLVCHAWSGRSEFEDQQARDLAALGYAALACDVYGKGVRGTSREENAALLGTMRDNRPLLLRRLLAGVDCLKQQAGVDAHRIAAIGFCFGGLCVLDIARSGADLAGVVSFHGLLDAPPEKTSTNIRARVLALHGWDDPMATPEDVNTFSREMADRKADWQLHAYGNTVHAFTNPQANDPDHGTVYSPLAARRSWRAMQNFLEEIFTDNDR